jgi:hypothetical protein
MHHEGLSRRVGRWVSSGQRAMSGFMLCGVMVAGCGNGLGRPLDAVGDGVARAGVSAGASLAELSDPERVQTPLDLYRNLDVIAQRMSAQKDPAGMFPLAYVAVSKHAWEALESGKLKHPQMTAALMVDFGRRFLAPLHAYVTGKHPGDVWTSYYQVAKENANPTQRTLGMGFNAHLSLDLAETLAAIKAPPSFREEYVELGAALYLANPEIARSMKEQYQHSCDPLLQGFSVGRGLDRLIGEGNSAKLTFQLIRQEAWAQGQLLQKSRNPAEVRSQMRRAFEVREKLLARLKD